MHNSDHLHFRAVDADCSCGSYFRQLPVMVNLDTISFLHGLPYETYSHGSGRLGAHRHLSACLQLIDLAPGLSLISLERLIIS